MEDVKSICAECGDDTYKITRRGRPLCYECWQEMVAWIRQKKGNNGCVRCGKEVYRTTRTGRALCYECWQGMLAWIRQKNTEKNGE